MIFFAELDAHNSKELPEPKVAEATIRRYSRERKRAAGTIRAWAVDPAILSYEAVNRAVEAIRSSGKLPRTAPASQLNLINRAHSEVSIMSLDRKVRGTPRGRTVPEPVVELCPSRRLGDGRS
jgi:hypothetical protein